MIDVIELTKSLIACPSVTPKDEGAQIVLEKALTTLGFECYHLPFEDVPNLFARRGTDGPHICFAGHTDVVPSGPENLWTFGPFTPEIENNILYGRGASDMKGSVAAFVAAISAYLDQNSLTSGSISLLITGDEEGEAINGTAKVLEWMQDNNHTPDVCLVGEPTNPEFLGQELKIGRRGSLTGKLTVYGKQGHVAYPHLADNPIPRMIKMLQNLIDHTFDKGNEYFPPTTFEITSVDVGNTADNVIPESVNAAFNLRFNDHWKASKLMDAINTILQQTPGAYEISYRSSGDSFLTQPGPWSEIVKQAVIDLTGKTPTYTTSGGTSDARFIQAYCPVVEFGGINKTIHQINENAKVKDLQTLTGIYTRVLELYFR